MINKVVELYENNTSVKTIQKELGISSGKIYKILDDNQIQRKKGGVISQ